MVSEGIPFKYILGGCKIIVLRTTGGMVTFGGHTTKVITVCALVINPKYLLQSDAKYPAA